MKKLSKANLKVSRTESAFGAAPVVGVAALWISLFKQLLYPALYAYYRTGDDGALVAQWVFAAALVACVFAIATAHAHLDWLLGRGRWAVAAAGAVGACGIALRAFGDFSTGAGAAAVFLGSGLSALYLPVHLAFWALYARHDRAFGTARLAVLSFLLFLATYLLLTAAGANSIYVSIACPIVSGAMALACPRAEQDEQDSQGAGNHISSFAQTDAECPAPGILQPAAAIEQPVVMHALPTAASAANSSTLTPGASAPAELPSGFADRFALSEREAELAAYARRNYSARKIASELFIAESTVYTHLKRIYRKTGVHSKHELIDLIDSWQT